MAELVEIPLAQSLTQELCALQQHYVILARNEEISGLLQEEREAYELLIEAVDALKSSFGQDKLLHLKAQVFDDDPLLRVTVQLPASFPEPESGLRRFDAAWWLKNCHRSGGGLVFDYEIQDGV